jgi:hypothetical protein
MRANLLDDGVGDTLVLPAFEDVTFISHGKRVGLGTRIKELNRPACSQPHLSAVRAATVSPLRQSMEIRPQVLAELDGT